MLRDISSNRAPASYVDSTQITDLLRAHTSGDEAALHRLVALVYPDLRRLARAQLTRNPAQQTLDTTGLVHEAYIKLADASRTAWQSRGHFFAVAARAMRQILVDAARARLTAKRGHGRRPEVLDDAAVAANAQSEDLVARHEALDRLGALDPRLVRVVECRYFAGFTEEETAEALDISLRTVQREWKLARSWLRTELSR